jgi:hypothetical protein
MAQRLGLRQASQVSDRPLVPPQTPVPPVSFADLVAGKAPPASSGGGGGGGPAPAGRGDVRGAFSGTAGQRRPVPAHVLDQEYDLVHQVGGWG